ncbi:unnamed protein product [Moneuplotes crassus]|uniref:Uncharacterized protein n=1 Tax=Euplotes crassus TaxID=5936 RepID=A0AAD1U4X4_EUPCR|nr:unnamed protein product [Moneuplotes crassus]
MEVIQEQEREEASDRDFEGENIENSTTGKEIRIRISKVPVVGSDTQSSSGCDNLLIYNIDFPSQDIDWSKVQQMYIRNPTNETNSFCFILTNKSDLFLMGNFSKLKTTNFKYCSVMPENMSGVWKGKISNFICNSSCALLLSQDGMVYSWGADINQTGVLGISKGIHDQSTPCPLHKLIDYSIKDIKMTENKAWAIDSKGKLFIWGSYDITQLNSWSNIISNKIIIPQPIIVDALLKYFVVKATPFSYTKSEETSLNICFKAYCNNFEEKLFGVVLGYNPKCSSSRKEVFLTSSSFVETRCRPKYNVDLGKVSSDMKSKTVISPIEPVPQIYNRKLLLKNIDEYIFINSRMVALLTVPENDQDSDNKYPHLLILTIPEILSEETDQEPDFLLYEIPSSLHLVDLKKAKFLASGENLVCFYGRDVIYWQICENNDEERGLLVNYGHLKFTHPVQNLCPDEIQNIIYISPSDNPMRDSTKENSPLNNSTSDYDKSPQLIEKLYRRYLVTYYPPLFDGYRYEEEESDNEKDDVEVIIEEDTDKYSKLPEILSNLYTKRTKFAYEAIKFYSESILKVTRKLITLENILTFSKDHLQSTVNQTNKFGKSMQRAAIQKIQDFSKKVHSYRNGFKILKRLSQYREKHQVIKYWYRWKLSYLNIPRVDSFDKVSDISSVIGESKRKVIRSNKFSRVSKNLENSSFQQLKENYFERNSSHERRFIKKNKKKPNLSMYFSKEPKSTYKNFLSNASISNVKTRNEQQENFDKSIDASKIEVEEIECIMASDDSIFNHFNLIQKQVESSKLKESRGSTKLKKSRDLTYEFHRSSHEKENYTLNNNISIIDSKKSSDCNSDKKKLYLKNRRFERRPHYITNRSNSSSKHFNSAAFSPAEKFPVMDESTHSRVPAGSRPERRRSGNYFHNRNMSNPMNNVVTLNYKTTCPSNAKATSRLLTNKRNNSAMGSYAESNPNPKIASVKSPSSIECTTEHSKKIHDIMKNYNEEKANCNCTTCTFMRRDFKSEDFHSIDLSCIEKSNSNNNLLDDPSQMCKYVRLPIKDATEKLDDSPLMIKLLTEESDISNPPTIENPRAFPIQQKADIRETAKFSSICTKINNFSQFHKHQPIKHKKKTIKSSKNIPKPAGISSVAIRRDNIKRNKRRNIFKSSSVQKLKKCDPPDAACLR